MKNEASPPDAGPLPWWQRLAVDEPLSPDALAWAAKSVGANARVTVVRQMTGGLVSSVHLLTIEDSSGSSHEVILRRLASSRGEGAQEMIRQEVAILRGLSSAGLPVPVPLDFDASGESTGGLPSLLMTRVPGEINLAPRDGRSWLGQMAGMLARIHSTRPDVMLPSRELRGLRMTGHEPWMSRPHLWKRAYEIAAVPPSSPAPRSLVHGDFQHFNLLWADNVLTGVVDWGSARIGCPDSDVGHCRLNLAVLFSSDLAEQFLQAYESEAGRRVDPWWDLADLVQYSPDWQRFIPVQVAGRIPVDAEGMPQRVEELIEATLARF